MRKHLSFKQLEANRRNALRSTGPRTDAGKSIAKFNALKHGLYAEDLIINTASYSEDADTFRQLLADIAQRCQPVGSVETFLVERAAACIWRLRRLYLAEKGETERHIHSQEVPPAAQESAHQPVTRVVIHASDPDVHGDPEDSGYIKYAEYEAELDKLREENRALLEGPSQLPSILLPRERMETIARYETTLERQLYKALDRLERLQRIRKGEHLPPPLNLHLNT